MPTNRIPYFKTLNPLFLSEGGKEWHTQTGFKWDENTILGADAKFSPKTNPSTPVNGKYGYIITAAYGSSIYWKPAQ